MPDGGGERVPPEGVGQGATDHDLQHPGPARAQQLGQGRAHLQIYTELHGGEARLVRRASNRGPGSLTVRHYTMLNEHDKHLLGPGDGDPLPAHRAADLREARVVQVGAHVTVAVEVHL